MRQCLEPFGDEYQGLALAGRERARGPPGEPALPGWNAACSALTQPPAGVHRSARRSCQPSPADGHAHVLGPCPGWMALLTGCGLWSRRAGSGGSSVLIRPVLDSPGRLPTPPPKRPGAQQGSAAPAQSSQLGFGEARDRRVSQLLPCNARPLTARSERPVPQQCWNDRPR